jgi:predicted NBD/HSP70 family sugar kinase
VNPAAPHEPINVNTVKRRNRASVFNELLRRGELTRTEIARATGLSLGTIATIVDELAGYGLADEYKAPSGSVGRRPNIVGLRPTGKRVAAIDLSSKNLRFELSNADLSSVAGGTYQFDRGRDYEAGITDLCRQIRQELEVRGIEDGELIGIGVAAPGPYDENSDRVHDPSFPELGKLELRSLVGRYFDQPVSVDHDVFLATRAELRYVPEFAEKVVFYVYLGEGVGGALASSGTVHRGARGVAGEIGNVRLPGGARLEKLVSWDRISDKAPFVDEPADRMLIEQFTDEGSELHGAVAEVAGHVAAALHDLYWVIDPHSVIVAGAYQLFGEGFLEMVKVELIRLIPQAMDSLELRLPQLGSRGALAGAAELSRERWLESL